MLITNRDVVHSRNAERGDAMKNSPPRLASRQRRSRVGHPSYSSHRHLYPLSPLRQDEMRRTVGENGNIAEGSSRGRDGSPLFSRMTQVNCESM
jgi:hypothetical protein